MARHQDGMRSRHSPRSGWLPCQVAVAFPPGWRERINESAIPDSVSGRRTGPGVRRGQAARASRLALLRGHPLVLVRLWCRVRLLAQARVSARRRLAAAAILVTAALVGGCASAPATASSPECVASLLAIER